MYIYLILALFLICPNLFTAPIIQLSLIPTKEVVRSRIESKVTGSVTQEPLEAGFIVTYGGFADVSDWDGLVSLPRKQADRSLNLLITQDAMPRAMLHNTLSHWELVPGVAAELYRFEQKKDPVTDMVTWNIIRLPLPADTIIPLDTVILFADPGSVAISTENQPALNNENLILPSIVIKGAADVAKNAIIFLHMRHFFEGTGTAFNKQINRYEMILGPS